MRKKRKRRAKQAEEAQAAQSVGEASAENVEQTDAENAEKNEADGEGDEPNDGSVAAKGKGAKTAKTSKTSKASDDKAEGEAESDAPVEEAEDAEAAEGETEDDASAAAETSSKPDVPEGEVLKRVLESLLFVSEGPLTVNRMRQLTHVKSNQIIRESVEELREEYASRGIVLYKVSGGYQFRSNAASSHWVQKLVVGKPVRLSRAQLETLSIIAYRQPITRPEIDEIRGVDSASTLRLLLERDLIRVMGKKEEPGRPLLYGSTPEFLEFFNLNDLRDLPTLKEYSELTDESMALVEDTLGEEAAELSARELAGEVPPSDSDTESDSDASVKASGDDESHGETSEDALEADTASAESTEEVLSEEPADEPLGNVVAFDADESSDESDELSVA